MASIKKRMDDKKKKEAIRMLDQIKDRIKSGDLIVESQGMWAGMPGSWNFKIILIEKDSHQSNSNG